MKLIPEQVINLRKKLNFVTMEKEDYDGYLRDRSTLVRDDTLGYHVHDNFTELNYSMIIEDITQIEKLLSESEIVYNPNLDKIDIGTKFRLMFDLGDIEDFVLIETIDGTEITDGTISIYSPIGKNVLGKKDGDTFYFDTPSGKRSAKVLNIIRDNSKYIKPIRESGLYRTCYTARKEINNAILEDKYDEWLVMSKSQKYLLENELLKLSKNISFDNKETVKNRVKAIKKTLSMYSVKNKISSDTIDVGTFFSFRLIGEDAEFNYENVEFINRALSTELKELYVERISNLGSCLYGLGVNDTFKIKINNKWYIGEVTNISRKNVSEVNMQYKI